MGSFRRSATSMAMRENQARTSLAPLWPPRQTYDEAGDHEGRCQRLQVPKPGLGHQFRSGSSPQGGQLLRKEEQGHAPTPNLRVSHARRPCSIVSADVLNRGVAGVGLWQWKHQMWSSSPKTSRGERVLCPSDEMRSFALICQRHASGGKCTNSWESKSCMRPAEKKAVRSENVPEASSSGRARRPQS